jgi:hypothetical protein
MIKKTNFSIFASVEKIKLNTNTLQCMQFLVCKKFLKLILSTNCPNPLEDNSEKVDHLWTDTTIWPNGVLPTEGEDVTI